jgi:uncharacterized membrane protein
MRIMRAQSDGKSSLVDLPLDELVELLPADRLAAKPTNRVDDLHQLLIRIAVFQLLVDVAQVVQMKLALALHVQQGEVGASAFLREWATLSR